MTYCDDCSKKCRQFGKEIRCSGKKYLKHREPLTFMEGLLEHLDSFNHPALKAIRLREEV